MTNEEIARFFNDTRAFIQRDVVNPRLLHSRHALIGFFHSKEVMVRLNE